MVTRNNPTNHANLRSTSTVKELVPKNTTFAVIAELAEQRFNGPAYLCVSTSQLRIISAKGVLAKVDLVNVAIKFTHGKYIINIADRAYVILSLSVIAGSHSFASRVAGIDGGVSPLLNALSAGGASVRGISGAKYYILAVILAFAFILSLGVVAYVTLS